MLRIPDAEGSFVGQPRQARPSVPLKLTIVLFAIAAVLWGIALYALVISYSPDNDLIETVASHP
jgi:hypothetical protein